MPGLPAEVLYTKLMAALPHATVTSDPGEVRPALVALPGRNRFRIYLMTCTPDRSEHSRPSGEHKIQLILPGQRKGASTPQSLDFTPDRTTELLGYSTVFGVFIGWEAPCYTAFKHSSNVQVGEALLQEAQATGWAVDIRDKRTGSRPREVRVAFAPHHLGHFLLTSRRAEEGRLGGWKREAFFWANSPFTDVVENLPAHMDKASVVSYSARQRRRIHQRSWSRDSRFSPTVKAVYGHACALCGLQLEIVEAAHIIPASDLSGVDEPWNGIALCPTHHALFDAHLVTVRPDFTLAIDEVRLDLLDQLGLGRGTQHLRQGQQRPVTRPEGLTDNQRHRLEEALAWRLNISGLR